MNEKPDLTRLVRDAWLLYNLTIQIETTLLDTFLEEFLDIDDQEQLLRDSQEHPPF